MKLLDLLAGWIQRLPVLPAEARGVLWLPLLFVVVAVGLRLLVRHALPPLGRLASAGFGLVAVLLGAVLLLPDLLVATAFRQGGNRPPAVIYGYGDAVVSLVLSLQRLGAGCAPVARRLAAVNLGLILLVAVGWLWWWNQRHCPDGSPGSCLRPVQMWTAAFDE
ncbi:hypothetical protein [Micromonospora siamensis]|uniref:Uncharacterized protein n=1 Tax=Micromonospora siamensis TaxID=299152 RepID=A0A1C5JQX3_9ACTN|nr:hypothetical protein [Micromonospora siamensis]SCG72982.1 hypothetical protein GA0074704_4846 [Micromonospora siamensis]